MATFAHSGPDWSLEVPDNPTVIQIVRYDSALMSARDDPAFLALWNAAKTVITKWECAVMPDITVNLNTLTGLDTALVVEGVGVSVSAWRRALDTVPKNS